MEKNETPELYINFPLCLLIETYENPDRGWNRILNYGIVAFAKKFKYEIKEVGRQLMYCYYRDKRSIPWKLLQQLEDYIEDGDLEIDEDYNGFGPDGFDPFEAFDCELFDLFEEDQVFKEQAILFYQVRQVLKLGGLQAKNGVIDSIVRLHHEAASFIEDFESKFGADAMVGVKVDLIFQARDNKVDRDIFRAYVAVKSLLGKKKYVASNKPAILTRMVGCKTVEAFNFYTTNKSNIRKSLLLTVEWKKR